MPASFFECITTMYYDRRGKMRYELAIFDMDGTILDTLQDLADSTNHALTANGLPERSIDEVRNFVGNGIRRLIERAVPDGCPGEIRDKVFRDFNEYYRDHCFDSTKPYDGIMECLGQLKRSGVRLAVVSNKAQYAVSELDVRFFPGVFDEAVGEREGIRRKPYPDSVLHVIDEAGIPKEKAVYIGDSEVDVQTAKNAGIDGIAVEWGFRDGEFLKEQGAVMLVKSPQELLAALGAAFA